MTEEEKKAARDKVAAMSQRERQFALAEIAECLPKKEIHRMDFLVTSVHEILERLGIPSTAENASKIYEPVTLLAHFDNLYDNNESGFRDVFMEGDQKK